MAQHIVSKEVIERLTQPAAQINSGKPVFVFAGQGSQWAAMAQNLLNEPIFLKMLETCEPIVQEELGWSLIEEMKRPEKDSRLENSLIAQPAIFAIQMGLVALFKQWGIKPAAVIGHSVGEVAAACTAGILDLEQAMRVICCQNHIMQRIVGKGHMLFVAMGSDQLKALLQHNSNISYAAFNSPNATVLSSQEPLDNIIEELKQQDVFCRALQIDIAFHSEQIEPHKDDLASSLADIIPQKSTIPIFSTLRGTLAHSGDYDGNYWSRHMREPVFFREALETALQADFDLILEIGPHPVLAQSIDECRRAIKLNCVRSLPTLRRKGHDKEELLSTLVQLSVSGCNVNTMAISTEERNLYQEMEKIAQSTTDQNVKTTTESILQTASNNTEQTTAEHFIQTKTKQEANKQDTCRKIENNIISILDEISDARLTDINDVKLGFMHMGFDSVMAVRFSRVLGIKFKYDFPATLAFNYPNTAALTNYIYELLFSADHNSFTTTTKTTQGLSDKSSSSHFNSNTSNSNEPIAIIGMGCRFPGGANDPDTFWNLLSEGRHGMVDIPNDRWDINAYYDEDPDAPGKMYTRKGGFLKQVDIKAMDSGFFKIAPKEARALDPQQRLLLEVSNEALENAGLTEQDTSGRPIGVFLGISTDDYKKAHLFADNLEHMDAYAGLGSMFSSAGGRLSFLMNLQGPNISVDTACSSSLVALHLACQSIRNGESEAALVAGVNIMTSPNLYIYFSKLRALSPEGRCKAFDDSANGYARGEGCGVLVLKPLSSAQRNGDNILAVIRSTAVNQDGASSGFTTPNGIAQQRVITSALNAAGLNPQDISYVEAHGTGTPLGDPIEVGALGNAYGDNRSKENNLNIGSVKANIGHLEAAAGMAGIIKVIQSMRNETIPGQPDLGQLNSRINWEQLPITVSAKPKSWQRSEQPRRAGVSGFGFSGTNAHVILEEAPANHEHPTNKCLDSEYPENKHPVDTPHLVTLSAKNINALSELASCYLNKVHDMDLQAVAYTSRCHRNHYQHRLAISATDMHRLNDGLSHFLENPHSKISTKKRKLAFMFTGQGAQRFGMGADLYKTQVAFKKAIDACATVLDNELDIPLTQLLFNEPERIHQTCYTQPALFAFEYALSCLWAEMGVVPDIVMGHSIGEYTAAVIAGTLELDDALKLVSLRARLMQSLPQTGSMSLISAPHTKVASVIADYHDTVALAADNGPHHCVISGSSEHVAACVSRFEKMNIRTRKLNVSHAFHSANMDPILKEFEQAVATLTIKAPHTTLISNLTGKPADLTTLSKPSYWSQHLRNTVRFRECVLSAAKLGCNLFLELGPAPTLTQLSAATLDDSTIVCLSATHAIQADSQRFVEVQGKLYEAGINLNWRTTTLKARIVQLPNYAYQRESYWMPTTSNNTHKQHIPNHGHPLIGSRINSPALGTDCVYETRFNRVDHRFLEEHQLFDRMIFPGAGHLAMTLAAAAEQSSEQKNASCYLHDFSFTAPLIVNTDEHRPVQLILKSHDNTPVSQGSSNAWDVRLVSRDEQDVQWTTHSNGRLFENVQINKPQLFDISFNTTELQSTLPHYQTGTQFYGPFVESGYLIGSSYRNIQKTWHSDKESLCMLNVEQPSMLPSPGLLDSILQSLAVASPTSLETLGNGDLFIPFSLGRLYRTDAPFTRKIWCHANSHKSDRDGMLGSITVSNQDGLILMHIEDLLIRRAERKAVLRSLGPQAQHELALQQVWHPHPLTATSPPNKQTVWLLAEENQHQEIVHAFEDKGIHCVELSVSKKLVHTENGFGLDPEQTEHWVQLLNEASTSTPSHVIVAITKKNLSTDYSDLNTISELITLSSCNTLSSSDISSDHNTLQGQLRHAVTALPALATAITQAAIQCRMWLCTQSAQDTQNIHALPGVAANGVALAIAAEHPDFWGGAVDLYDSSVNNLVDEVLAQSDEIRVSYHHNQRKVERLEALPLPNAHQLEIQSDSAYLITGGLGAIGLQTAEWLAQKGAGHIALTGRRQLNDEIVNQLENLKQKGVSAAYYQADICNEVDVERTLLEISKVAPLKGIMHAAGILDDGMLATQNWPRMQKVMQGKLFGAWVLHRKTDNLDFMILCSSMAAALGNRGQANYAAANAGLDMLARYRSAQGLKTLSVQWGPWEGKGMAVGKARQWLDRQGFKPLNGEQCFTHLDALLQLQTPVAAVVDCNWDKYITNSPRHNNLLSLLIDKENTQHSVNMNGISSLSSNTSHRQKPHSQKALLELQHAAPEERLDLIQQAVKRIAEAVFGGSTLNISDPLADQGFDSLMAVEIQTTLNRELGTSLSASLMYNHPSLEAISHYLHEEVLTFEEIESVVQHSSEDAENEFEFLDNMSSEDLEAYITEEMMSLN